MTIPDNYRKPILIAVLLHVALFLFLILNFAATHFRMPSASAPQATIHATAISLLQSEASNTEKAHPQKLMWEHERTSNQHTVETEALATAREHSEQKNLAQAQAQKIKAATAAKKQAGKKKVLLIAHEKLAKEKAAEKALADDAHQKLMREQERAVQASEIQKLQQQLLQQQLNSEQKNISTVVSQAQQGQIDQYKAQILALIQSNWRIDQVNSQLKCIYDVSVAPDGTVLSIMLQKSSGSTDLDQSAKQAIEQSSPLPVPQSPTLFSHFRQLVLTLSPQGYLQSVN